MILTTVDAAYANFQDIMEPKRGLLSAVTMANPETDAFLRQVLSVVDKYGDTTNNTQRDNEITQIALEAKRASDEGGEELQEQLRTLQHKLNLAKAAKEKAADAMKADFQRQEKAIQAMKEEAGNKEKRQRSTQLAVRAAEEKMKAVRKVVDEATALLKEAENESLSPRYDTTKEHLRPSKKAKLSGERKPPVVWET
jgi:hypothetical protein